MAAARLVFVVVFALGCAASHAQPTRVRGTVVSFQAEVLTVRDAARTHEIQVQDKTEIVFAKPISIDEIRPGDFLGVTSVKRPDGTLTAYEVRRFPKPLNPGHRPFDGREGETMTNATVGAMVQSASGRELIMTYEGGVQKIVLPQNASISTLVPGRRAQLVPGAPVNLTMDANRVAQRIQVSAKAP
jgi:hypothetical protein